MTGTETGELTEYRTVADQAYAVLKRRILTGELPPGSRIDQDDEARRLSASLTPIREAMRRLESEGLVDVLRHRGVLVKSLSREDLEDLYVIRVALEGFAARLGAERIDDAAIASMRELLDGMERVTVINDVDAWLQADQNFLSILYRASDHPRLFNLINGLREEAGRYRMLRMARIDEQALVVRNHRELLQACMRRDGAGAERTIRQSLGRSLELLRVLVPGE